MIPREKIIEAFEELGFHLGQIVESEWLGFSFEGNKYMYLSDNEEEEYLSISIPYIYELKDDNFNKFVKLEEWINYASKCVKASNRDNSLWLFYERKLLNEEDLKLVISHMVMSLDYVLYTAHRFIEDLETEDENEDENANYNQNNQSDYAEMINEPEMTDISEKIDDSLWPDLISDNNEEQNLEKTVLGNLKEKLSLFIKRKSTDKEPCE